MKISKNKIISIAVITTAISVASVIGVAAEGVVLTEGQLAQIGGSCLTTKNTLTQLHSSDALLRVNRGQIYESMYTKLMDRFNSRLASNKLDNTKLKQTADDYSIALNKFREDYKSYEEQLSKALEIDCPKKPQQYYEAVSLARTMRSQIHDDVVKLNGYIDQYNTDLSEFSATYKTNTEATN